MRWLRLLFRIFGWLLTPFLAWAASFFGAVAGALLAMRMADPVRGLIVTAVCGGLAGFAAIIGWLRYLRRSPEVRQVLAVTEDGTPDTTEMRTGGLVVLAMLSLPSAAAQAQTIGGSFGRFYDDGGWTSYRVGFAAARAGILGVQLHGDAWKRVGGADGGFAGLGLDVTAFRSDRDGPYLVAGVGSGLGAETTNSYSDLWASWSAGAGYQLFPVSFLSVGLEGRWRTISLGKRKGFELTAGLGLHFGGHRRPPRRRRPPPPAKPPLVIADSMMTPAPPRTTMPSTASRTDSVIATATAAMGRRYEFGGTGADSSGFDCSGLIQYAFGKHGVTLPRRSEDQARAGREVSKQLDQLLPGDLLTFSNRGSPITHVGLYLGDGRFIHSATRGVQVSLLSADDPYGRWWYKRWRGVRRIIG